MKLSTKSRYGARILLELSRQPAKIPLQVGEISRRQEIPVKYLEQLIRVLKKAEMVNSVRGPKGGHLMARPAEKITLGEVVRIFEGQSDLVACVSDPGICKMADDCRVRDVWKDATAALYSILDNTTIADLREGFPKEVSPNC